MDDVNTSDNFEHREFARFRHDLTVTVPKDADLPKMEAVAKEACDKLVQHVFRCLVIGGSATVSVSLQEQQANQGSPVTLADALKATRKYIRYIGFAKDIAKQMDLDPASIGRFLNGKRPLTKGLVDQLLILIDGSPHGGDSEWRIARAIIASADWPTREYHRTKPPKAP